MKTHSISNPELIYLLTPDEPGGLPIAEVDLSRVFCEILRRANDFVSSQAGAIYLLDASVLESQDVPPEMVLVASFGLAGRSLEGEPLPISEGLAGQVLSHGESLVGDQPTSDSLLDSPGRDVRSQGSVVALPLLVGRRVVGALELMQAPDAAFSERELSILETFAQTISAAIANAIEAQRSKDMARRDDLTRLYNDRFLHQNLTLELRRLIAEGQDCGLLFIDLDRFKRINDSHGHLVGSRVLREVGGLLRQVLPGPAIAARYGGDEFVVVLPGHSPQESSWVADTIRQSIESHVFLEVADPEDPENYPALGLADLTASIGLVTLEADIVPLFETRTIELVALKNELLRAADRRMYRAKATGRNRIVATSERLQEITLLGAEER